MREMGTLAGVPIEPPEQTRLLDACVSQAGVIGGGVPGGASRSRTFMLYLSDQVLQKKLEVMTLSGYSSVTQLIVPQTNDPQNESNTFGVITVTLMCRPCPHQRVQQEGVG